MKHWDRFSKEFDVEDAVGEPSGKVSYAGIVDLNQLSSTNFPEKEIATSTYQKDGQAYADSAVRLADAITRRYVACIVLGILVLLIICGFIVFLLRGDSSILFVVLGLVEGLVGGVLGYYFGRREKS